VEHHVWHEHTLRLEDHEMAWYEAGRGDPLLFLHGCYDSLLYRPFAELFAHEYRCILYDQRGAERSRLDLLDEQSLHVDKFVRDLDSLRGHLGLDKASLIGHSWGATLGLLYAASFPERVRRLVLVGIGPVTDEMHAVYRANVLRMMDPEHRPRYKQVNDAYKAAWRSGGSVPEELDRESITMWSPVMFYAREQADKFRREYIAAGGYRRHVPLATGFARDRVLQAAEQVTAPVLILYGLQDYEPITQGYLLSERVKCARTSFINECGHMVWMDQPERTWSEICAFLRDS
jgi:proline iminopeptidase